MKKAHVFVAILLAMTVLGISNAQSIFSDDDNEDPDAEGKPVEGPTTEVNNSEVKVLYQKRTSTETGYKFVYELSDGQGREEIGTIHNAGTDQQYMEVNGFYRYNGPDNFIYRITYKSGPDGYQAQFSRYKSKNRIDPIALKSLVG